MNNSLLVGSMLAASALLQARPVDSPNIIYILADDVGYGDISCMSPSSKIHTPNIDAIAKNGIRFTDCHSNSASCTPSRYSILTGRHSWRSTLKQGICWGDTPTILEPGRMTIASMLKTRGYTTAAIGKWHLGWSWGRKDGKRKAIDFSKPIKNGPTTKGFDYFFGLVASLDISPYAFVRNDRATAIPNRIQPQGKGKTFNIRGPIAADMTLEGTQPRLTEEALKYLDEKMKNKEKFFLYFPLTAAHAPILPTKEFQGKSGLNEYADFVLMIDDIVGKIRKKVRDYNMQDDTIIIFTSDNGCAKTVNFPELLAKGHNPNANFRGHKATLWEAGHRIPYVMEYPKLIKAGSVSNQLIGQCDLFRTLAELTGATVPDNAAEDSFSYLSILKGDDKPVREALVHMGPDGCLSLRKGNWKALFSQGGWGWNPTNPKLPARQLYNLKEDVEETNNLYRVRTDKMEELRQILYRYIVNGRSTPGPKQPNTPVKRWPQLQSVDHPFIYTKRAL